MSIDNQKRIAMIKPKETQKGCWAKERYRKQSIYTYYTHSTAQKGQPSDNKVKEQVHITAKLQ